MYREKFPVDSRLKTPLADLFGLSFFRYLTKKVLGSRGLHEFEDTVQQEKSIVDFDPNQSAAETLEVIAWIGQHVQKPRKRRKKGNKSNRNNANH